MLQHVYVPTEINEAITRLAQEPASALLAGGTLLMPVVNNNATPIRSLVSIKRLPLNGVAVDAGLARVGATTRLADLGRAPQLGFLQPVVESIASPPIRNLATVGGNLFAPQPYGDLAVALLALDANVGIVGPSGSRNVPVGDVLESGVAAEEIVADVSFAIPAVGTWFYTKAMRRKLNSASIVTVAAIIETAAGMVTTAHVALGGVAVRPVRAGTVERALIGKPFDDKSVAAAAALAIDDVSPFSDAYASAWYRARVLPVHVRRAILGQ